MLKDYKGKLFCFSPPVMLATFLLEFAMLFYVLWRYKLNTVSRLVASILGCLGVFQLAEYMICGGLGLNTAEWSRLGYASITLLPPLGVHLVSAIAGKKSVPLLVSAYGTSILFALYLVFIPGAININECRANYAVFDMGSIQAQLYGVLYYSWLFTGIFLALRWAKRQPEQAKALYMMVLGYLVFIVPTTIVALMDRATVSGIPSIMCGFAVLLAAIMVSQVMPLVGEGKQLEGKKSSLRSKNS